MKHLQDIAVLIDTRSLRERVLFAVTGVALLGLVAHLVVFASFDRSHQRIEQQIASSQSEIETLNLELVSLADALERNTEDAYRRRLTDLQQQLSGGQGSLTALTEGLVRPKAMARLVEDILKSENNLRLIRIENSAPIPISGPNAESGTDRSSPSNPGGSVAVYKHGMSIEIDGSYWDLVHFLSALEQMPWRVLREGVELQAVKYPISRVKLTLYTLSLDRTWLEV